MNLSPQEQIIFAKELHQLKDSVYRKQLELDLAFAMSELSSCKDEIQMRWTQGQVQYINKKLAEFDSARDRLAKLETRRPDMSKSF